MLRFNTVDDVVHLRFDLLKHFTPSSHPERGRQLPVRPFLAARQARRISPPVKVLAIVLPVQALLFMASALITVGAASDQNRPIAVAGNVVAAVVLVVAWRSWTSLTHRYWLGVPFLLVEALNAVSDIPALAGGIRTALPPVLLVADAGLSVAAIVVWVISVWNRRAPTTPPTGVRT